jgi:hypothetical protein
MFIGFKDAFIALGNKAPLIVSDSISLADLVNVIIGAIINVFLAFDGNLGEISAYDAALTLAHDTTFDVDGDLTCVWMDQHYNWGGVTFRNCCDESLSLAVNLIANVLHSFFDLVLFSGFDFEAL